MTGTKHTLFGLLSCAVMAYAGRFSKFKTCETCVAAGYGWSTQAGKCGGFPNKVCATAAKPASQSPPPPPGCNWNGACGKHDYDTCQKCVGAGSGWCPLQRRCGGYASSMCPDDERSAMRTPEEQKEYAKEMGVVPDATPDELAATAKRQQENYRKLMAGETVEKPKPAAGDDGQCTEETKEACGDDEKKVPTFFTDGGDVPNPGSDVIVLTDANFEAKLKDPDATWLLEFYAPWCGHCKEMAPAFEQAATELKGVAFVGKCDVTANERARFKFGVNAFPGIMVIHMHKLCNYDGADRSKEALKRFVDQGCAGSLGAQDMGVKLYGKKRDVRPPPEMPDECEKWEAKSAPAWLRDKSAQDKEVAKVLGLSKGYPRRTRTVVKKLADKEEVAVAFSLCEDSDVENVIPMLKSMIHHATVPIHVYAMAPEDVMPLLRCQTDGMSDLEGVFIEYIYQEDEMHFWREDLYNFAQGNPYKNDKGECNVAKMYFPVILDDIKRVIVLDAQDPGVMLADVGGLYMWFDAMDEEYMAAGTNQNPRYATSSMMTKYAVPEPVDGVGFSTTVTLYNLAKCREGGVNEGALKAMVGSWKNLGSMDDRDILNIFAKTPNFVSKLPCSWNVRESKKKGEVKKECLPLNFASLDPKAKSAKKSKLKAFVNAWKDVPIKDLK